MLDAPHDRLGPIAVGAHLCGGSLDVVRGSAQAKLAVVVEGPGRPRVAVERRAHAPGIHQEGAVRSGAFELAVAVTEKDPPFSLTREHAFLVRLRFGREAFDVGERRAMAD